MRSRTVVVVVIALTIALIAAWAVDGAQPDRPNPPAIGNGRDSSERAPTTKNERIHPNVYPGRQALGEDGATALVGRLLEDREDFPGPSWDPAWIVFRAIDGERILWHIVPAGLDPERIDVVLPNAGKREWGAFSVIRRNGSSEEPSHSDVDLGDGTFEVVLGVLWSGRLGIEPSPGLEAVSVDKSNVRGVPPGGPVVLPSWLDDDLDPQPLELLPPAGPDGSARFDGPVDPDDRVVCVREAGSAWVVSPVASREIVTPPVAGRLNLRVSRWSELQRPDLVLRSSRYGVAQVISPWEGGDFELNGLAVGTWDVLVRENFIRDGRLEQPTWAEARVVVDDTEATECVIDGPPRSDEDDRGYLCEGLIRVDSRWGEVKKPRLNLFYDDPGSRAYGSPSSSSLALKPDITGTGLVAEFSIRGLRAGRYFARVQPYGWSGILHAPSRDLVIVLGPPRTVEIVLRWPNASDQKEFRGFVTAYALRASKADDGLPVHSTQRELEAIEAGKRYSIRTCADRLHVDVDDLSEKSELVKASVDVDLPPGGDPLVVEIPMTRGGTVTAQARLDGTPLDSGWSAPFRFRFTSGDHPDSSYEIAPGVAWVLPEGAWKLEFVGELGANWSVTGAQSVNVRSGERSTVTFDISPREEPR